MSLANFYGSSRFGLSFELFPPKSPAGQRELFRNVAELVKFEPDYITCTYGAGGSTREKTLDIIQQVRGEHQLPVASHLTCVGATREQLADYLKEARERGVEHIVALRGDPPRGETTFTPTAGGLCFANDLVEMIRGDFPEFGIAVAGYPETHREATSPEDDLLNLRRKVASGGEVVITQLFYDNEDFFRFRDRCEELEIDAPIVPGILPVTKLAQIKRIAGLCGARLPQSFVGTLEKCGDDEEAQFEAGVEFATRQVQGLIDGGIPGIHFYVLNKSPATTHVLNAVTRPA